MKKPKTRKYPELTALKGLIREKKTSYRILSKDIEITTNSLSNKINGFYLFNSDDIEKIAEVLEIQAVDICKYFFPRILRNVSKSA